MQITPPPFVFAPDKLESWLFYPGNHLVRILLQIFPVRDVLDSIESEDTEGLEMRSVCLFCPAAVDLQAADKRFTLRQHNLLDPSPLPYKLDCLRAMNVINREYFTDD